jgi:hypothetical protein
MNQPPLMIRLTNTLHPSSFSIILRIMPYSVIFFHPVIMRKGPLLHIQRSILMYDNRTSNGGCKIKKKSFPLLPSDLAWWLHTDAVVTVWILLEFLHWYYYTVIKCSKTGKVRKNKKIHIFPSQNLTEEHHLHVYLFGEVLNCVSFIIFVCEFHKFLFRFT